MASRKIGKKPAKTDPKIDEQAKAAAREAIAELEAEELEAEEPDQADMRFTDDTFDSETATETQEKDIFLDAFKKASAKNDVPRFYIYKNSQFTTVKLHPYSFEKMQEEFGEGHYRIVAKSLKTGQNIMVQSELIGNPRPLEADKHEVHETEAHNQQTDPMAWVSLMTQIQEKSESKAQQAASTQMTAMATMMQMMMQSQQQASQQFQQMMMEMNKQTQTQAQTQQNLMMTLLTAQSNKKDEGFNAATVLKMVQDAARDAEVRTKNWFELVDKKAEALAEQKAEAMSAGDSESEESLTKTLIKGFVPVISQMMANQPGAQGQTQAAPTPAQIQAHNERLLAQQAAQDKARNEIERKRALALSEQKVPQDFAGASATDVKQSPKAVAPAPGLAPQTKTVTAQVVPTKVDKVEASTGRKEFAMSETKDKIFNEVAGDIGQALLMRKNAAKTAESCLKKLEKSGTPRQTVAEVFSLEDFKGYATKYGLPSAATPWIVEFYEYISAQGQKTTPGAGPVGAGARTRSNEPAKNI